MNPTTDYYVTRYVMSLIDSGTRRIFLTTTGEWTPDRDQAEKFATKTTAATTAERFPGSFVDGFTSYR